MFLRIYLGLLGTVVAAIVVCYLSYGYINERRMLVYETSIFSGTFKLIQAGLARHEGLQQEGWLQLASRLSGLNLVMRPKSDFSFDQNELYRLQNGEVLFRAGKKSNQFEVFAAVNEPANNDGKFGKDSMVVTTIIEKIAEQQLRVTALLTLNELGRHDPDQTVSQIRRLQKVIAFPIRQIAMSEIRLDPSQRARLLGGDVVVAWQVDNSGREVLLVYAPFGVGNLQPIELGPIPAFHNNPLSLMVALFLLGLLITAAGAYFLMHHVQRRVQAMSSKVAHFGNLNFDVRIEDTGDDEISALARSFDEMAERIVRLMTEQKHIIQAVSHELRTPLSRMIFRLDSIQSRAQETGDEVLLSKADGLRQDIDELSSLIDETLLYHQLDSNVENQIAQNDNWVVIDFSLLFEQIRKNLLPLHPGKTLSVQQNGTPGYSAQAYSRYIARLLQNLIINGLRFADQQVQVEINVTSEGCQLLVDDDGPGVCEHNRENIFDAYTRGDSSRNRKSGGYGLGLAIVKRIALLHGGSIGLSQSPLGGARFDFRWSGVEPDKDDF